MKNKPLRHKEENTFKFQSFADRIANIDVDIFHRVPHPNEEDSEGLECYFYQCLQKWDVLNLSESFGAIRKELFGIITLPQLLHKKDYVVNVLLKHLKLRNPLSLQPLLELVVALAKDLRKDFYPYYSEFLDELIVLLNTKDTEQLEWVFTALAYLFKFLWRYLIRDVSKVFVSLLPLLSDHKPPYITNFAAESFSFVARKVKDRKAFLSLILETIKDKQDGAIGCGKLLFEVVRGVSGNFHSCAESMLTFYFESLCDESLPQDTLHQVLQVFISNMTKHIRPRNTEIFWKTHISVNDKCITSWQSDQNSKSTIVTIELLMNLACQTLQAGMLHSPDLLVKHYLKVVVIDEVPESILLCFSKLCSLLLTSKNVQLPLEHASSLIRKTLSVPNHTLMLDFIQNLTTYTSFEALVLPALLKYYGQTLDEKAFRILTNLILQKAPLAQDGISLAQWTKYPLDFSNYTKSVCDHLLNILRQTDIGQLLKNLDNVMCALICIPHINSLNNKPIAKALAKLIEFVNQEISTNTDLCKKDIQKLLFVLANFTECFIHIEESDVIYRIYTVVNCLDTLLKLVQELPYRVCALRIIDMIITACNSSEIISMKNLQLLHKELYTFYSSPYHQIRLLTSHIYTLFEKLPELNIRSVTKPEEWQIFTLCFNCESIEALVHTYRDQLQNLEKLNYEKPQGSLCVDTDFATIPLRYLLGVLYMNFQLLWEPVIGLIATHAHGLPINIFWEVFLNQLNFCNENIKNTTDSCISPLESECHFIETLWTDTFEINDKPDFINYRTLLWRAMAEFSDVAETRNRDVTTLMLTFIEDEYRKSNDNEAVAWNIKQTSHDSVDADEDENDENSDIKKELTQSIKPTGKSKSNLKTLLSHLVLFSKFRNPKTMYREPELNKLYLDLLSHRNPEIQKTALNCIMAYKHKYLTPYQEHLYALIDDKKFKNELSLFRIDKESTIVVEEHRENLIPIVLRIVFSKMMAKTGLRTGGKASGQHRRQLVLRFLAGCHEHEMLQFIQMSFSFYDKYQNDDPEIMIKAIIDNLDLEKSIPPKRLQSTLNLLLIVLEQFGGLMGQTLLAYLLKVILIVSAAVCGALQQRESVHAGYLASLRNLRTSCLTIVGRFFAHFDSYPWTSKEINAVFEVCVWPWLDKLKTEGVYSPTALLKLFYQWGQNPRYFVLLVKHNKNNNEQYALPQIIDLLLGHKVHPSVTNTILEILEKLLLLKPDEDGSIPELCVDDVVPVAANILERLKLNEKLNYGSCILLPFVPSILDKLKRKLIGKNKRVNKRELFILSRISELVWEPETCDTVLSLLLPLLVKKASLGASDETIMQLITTAHNLVKNVNEPQKHFRRMAPLFGEVTGTQARKLLCEILINSSQFIESEIERASYNVVKEMNAYDARWLDQPDFQRRIDAFKKVDDMIKSDSIQLELGAIIIHNCFHVIKNENDLALRECARQCLRSLVPHLAHKYQTSPVDKEFLISETLLQLIRKGIKSKNEHFRHESISLLGHAARECSDVHVVLKDLSKFTNKQDLEVDFFENLLHLQLYRQTRALNKFCQVCAELKVALNPRTLTQFILPLVSMYLLTEKYKSKNSLIDAAIEAVKIICCMLPWHQYEGTLKYYLAQLRYKTDFQKQLVRLTVAILDAYHYDISKAKQAVTPITTKKENQTVSEKDDKMGDISKTSEETVSAPVEHQSENSDLNETKESISVAAENDSEEEEETEITERHIDDVLEDAGEDESLEEDEEALQQSNADIPAILRQTVLCPSAAKRVLFSIKTVLLPQLQKAMAEMTQHEGSHKLNRKKTGAEREEDELQRVPISLAVVKLLQKLPTHILEHNLPGVFMKLCTFLKSPLDSVRRLTRETLQSIMTSLGPNYMGLLISEMASLLSRGYQVHVLVYTIHSILVTLKDMFQPTNIDKCLLTILEVCKADLFGSLAEEKEVAKIVSKVSEAKSTKSFDTFQILAQYITEKCLMDLVLPLRQVLSLSHSHKIVNKVQECLRRIVLGLVDNTFVPVESLLVFAYGTASESVPQFIESNKRKPKEESVNNNPRQKQDCFIIPNPPVYKNGVRQNLVRTSATTNAHILVEFGLRLCHFILKREKITESEYKTYIDPFVVVFKNCLSSRHVKMCTLTMQCLSWVIKYELPSMKDNIKDIVVTTFELLHKYAAAGLSKGDNFDLVVAAFKTMAILVRDVKYYTIDNEQLKALLIYAEQDLHDYERQATAFALLKSIISRKLIVPVMHDVMAKVSELSITSEHPHIRAQCRQVFHQFLMDYPLGKKLDSHLAFFVSQLSYETMPGRQSALELLYGVIQSFPINVLKKQAGMLWVMIGARLVNDEAPECRKMAAKCVQHLLERLSKQDRDTLFDILKTWFKDQKISHRRLAAQMCGIVITVEKGAFNSRIPELTKIIKSQFSPDQDEDAPGRFVRIKPAVATSTNNDSENEGAKPEDHHLFQVLQMLLKLCSHCPTFLEQVDDIQIISEYVQTLLAYPHEWVRLGAAQFIGYVLSVLKVEHLSNLLVNNEADERGYLYTDPQNVVKSLTLDLCAQLQPGCIKAELAEQVIKNLVFMARVLQKVPINESDSENKYAVNLFWLTKRMRKIVNREIVEAPKSTILRTEVFKWIAGVVSTVEDVKIKQVLHHLLAPLVREMTTTEESNAPLRQLAKEVGNLLRRKVGTEDYIAAVSKLQLQLNVRRAERKRERTQLAVTDPDIAARKKIKMQGKKKEAKKRKIENFKGKKFIKKKRKTLDDVEIL